LKGNGRTDENEERWMKRWLTGGAVVLLALAVLGLSGWRLHKSRSYQVFGELIQRVETSDSAVALTFDDGPTPGFTAEVLQIFERAGVRATFFVVGEDLERWPGESRALVEAGHELGNHSYSHRTLVLKGPSSVRSEVVRTDSLIRAAGYTGEIHFRPPYGKKLFVLPWVLSRLGTKTVMWDIEPESFGAVARDPVRLREHVLERVAPGSIILLHPFFESRRPTLEALPALIEELQKEGYRMVTVSELLDGAES
jgi:peptidoglycan/xylan/chitin deacetylase (PgdA/CDA1 family)